MRPRLRLQSFAIRFSILVFVVVSALVLFSTEVYRDWGFICANTGSRRGHRDWLGTFETSHWYKESELESFIKKNYPSEFKHRWTSYEGTGRNIFGTAVLRGHGRPGAILQLSPELLVGMSDTDKKQLYDLLVQGDPKVIRARIEQLFDEYVARSSR